MSGDTLTSPDPRRIRYLDYLRGLTIILVVAGHYIPSRSPESWLIGNNLLHMFRMPIFFFLSGYLFCVEMTRHGDESVGTIVKKKAARLLIPWVTAAVGYLLVKLVLPFFMRLGEPLTRESFLNLFLDPANSYAPVIWFLQGLFIAITLFLILHVKLGLNPLIIFGLFFFLSFVQFPLWFSFDGAIKHMQYFTMGYLISLHSLDRRIDRKYLYLAVLVFLVNAVFFWSNPDNIVLKRIASYSGVASMILAAMLLSGSGSRISRLIERVGHYTMGIFLMHPYLVGAVAAVCYRRLNIPDNLFYLGLLAATVFAVAVSVIVEKHILRRFPVTRKYVLGMAK